VNDNNKSNESAKKPSANWKTGDDPATPAQKSHLESLAQQTGETPPHNISKAEASEKINELRNKAGLE
jgi:hypothetical protein